MIRSPVKPKLLFVTQSLGTRWEVYSQALIRASGLADRVIVLDGRSQWHPLNFVDQALAYESDYIVHVDEDCFLLDPTQLSALISDMMDDPDVVAAGVPDGGTPYRSRNPLACNLYFTVFKTAALREAIVHCLDWRSLRFQAEYADHLTQVRKPIALPPQESLEYEPYYPLFWLILAQAKKIIYLCSSMDTACMASQVFFGSETQPMALHGWHLRKWFSPEIDPFLGISPAEKYRRIARRLNGYFLRRPRLLWYGTLSAMCLLRMRMAERVV